MNPALTKLTHYHPCQPITFKDLYEAKPGDCFTLFEAVEDKSDWLVTSCPAQIMTNDGNYVEINCLPHMRSGNIMDERFHTIRAGGIIYFDENHDLDRVVGDEDFKEHIVWLEPCGEQDFRYELPPENAYTLKELLALLPATEVKIRMYSYFNTKTSIYRIARVSVPNVKTVLEPFTEEASTLTFTCKTKEMLPTKVFFENKSTTGKFCVAFPTK